jgi:ankyrin repeat protein
MNTDINYDYKHKATAVLLEDDDALLAAVEKALFYDNNELYFSNTIELGLPSSIFELVDFMGTEIPFRNIQDRLTKLDSRIILDTKLSKIIPNGDGYNITLAIEISGKKMVINRTMNNG